ncbi:Hypothetical_protein [Hexamita inflata]|uniref:Hypothetical_protein n=1 Tax=Hexamita inflata TaxID=28002 RepID=A0AA86V182_9EUKA|nr:Hypothetical protein HINF_LOCUS42108 [Hexamita inflata]
MILFFALQTLKQQTIQSFHNQDRVAVYVYSHSEMIKKARYSIQVPPILKPIWNSGSAQISERNSVKFFEEMEQSESPAASQTAELDHGAFNLLLVQQMQQLVSGIRIYSQSLTEMIASVNSLDAILLVVEQNAQIIRNNNERLVAHVLNQK